MVSGLPRAALFMVLAQVAACSSTGAPTASSPPRDEPDVYFGVVEAVRQVPLPGSSGMFGVMGGGAVGGVAGGHVGGGRGSQAGAAAGAVAGSIAGYALENAATTREGLEISVRLDSGQAKLIVQPDGESFKPGDRVKVLVGENGARVTH